MVHPISPTTLRSALANGQIKQRTREETLADIQRFQDAQKELEKRCADLGIPVPIMVC